MSSPWIVFIVALSIRVAAVWALGHYREPTLWENGVIAHYLQQGCGFCLDFSLTAEPSSWQAPTYPAMLFAAWRLFGVGWTAHLAISLAQAVALAAMVFPVGWLTRRWFGERAAVFAMWLASILPLYVWYATRLHQTGLVMAVHPWLLWWWLHLQDRPGAARGVWTGGVSAAAALLQPILLLPLACVGAVQAFGALRAGDRRRIVALSCALVAVVIGLTPWTVRNYVVHHRFIPIRDSFGKELWMGNNPFSTGTSFAIGGINEITYEHPPKAFALKGVVPEAELMDALRAEAVAYIRADPRAFVERTFRKILWLWTVAPAERVRHTLGGEAIAFRWLHVGTWTTFVGLCVVGLWSALPVPRGYAWMLGLYVVTYSTLYGLTHVGQARYRGEMEFIFIPLAALGLSTLASAVRRRS